VVSAHLNDISQIGSFLQVGVKMKNIWNHHLEQFFGGGHGDNRILGGQIRCSQLSEWLTQKYPIRVSQAAVTFSSLGGHGYNLWVWVTFSLTGPQKGHHFSQNFREKLPPNFHDLRAWAAAWAARNRFSPWVFPFPRLTGEQKTLRATPHDTRKQL